MSSDNQDLESILTPEEIEAMNAPDDDYDIDALKAVAGDSSDDDELDDDDEGDLDDAGGPPVEGKGAADESKEKEVPQGQVEPAQAEGESDVAAQADDQSAVKPAHRPFAYEARLSEQHQEIADKVALYEKDLKAKFKAGEIELDEYDEARDKIAQIRQKLDREALKVEISQEMGQQSAKQLWDNTVSSFLGSVKSELDYSADQTKAQDLDQFVKVLANNPAYAEKPMDWFLTEAHKRVKALHGIASAKPPAQTAQEAIDKAREGRRPPLAQAPKTLAQVPGSDGPGDVDSEFAHIDALEGFEAEEALARLSHAQRERYLRG